MFTGGLPGQHPGPACKSVGAHLTASSGRANHGINTTGGRKAIAQAHTGGGGGRGRRKKGGDTHTGGPFVHPLYSGCDDERVRTGPACRSKAGGVEMEGERRRGQGPWGAGSGTTGTSGMEVA